MACRMFIEDSDLYDLMRENSVYCKLKGEHTLIDENSVNIEVIYSPIEDYIDRRTINNDHVIHITKGELMKLIRVGKVLLDFCDKNGSYIELVAFNEKDWFKPQ
jgi:hypothetical protein